MPENDHLMRVDPVHASVGSFFEHKPMYRIPKYQRGYAWDKPEIEDFLQDVETCFDKRKAGQPTNHFFGGIVSVINNVTGVVNQSEFELVDGQQRMATFVLLMASVLGQYKALLRDATAIGDTVNQPIIEDRIKELTSRFIEFKQEINRNIQTVEVFILSKADQQFFRDLIRQVASTPQRDSHRKLQAAYKEITEKVKAFAGTGGLTQKMDNLEIIKQLMDGDFSLLHIKTFNKKEAYTLFRVLNDRGKNLTDGDLLRARVLELLEGHGAQQASAESIWDDILADPPSVTEDYLKAIFASVAGRRANANALFDDFLGVFYPQTHNPSISTTDANTILARTQELHTEIRNCRILANGEWPFPQRRPITPWDVNRLTLLLRELRITVTTPLLLSACKLAPTQFSEMVQLLERFMFRFKVIGNQHVTPFVNIIYTESVTIRNNPGAYNLNSLETALQGLQASKMPDAQFRSLLDSLNYKEGGGNQPLKYFLITLEHYYRWYRSGRPGKPVCLDKSRFYDFATTTIEHVYPRNAQGANVDPTLEPLKNALGNLTIMGPTDNVSGANDSFAIKKPIFDQSSVSMNKDIAQQSQWDEPTVTSRAEELKDMALAVFRV